MKKLIITIAMAITLMSCGEKTNPMGVEEIKLNVEKVESNSNAKILNIKDTTSYQTIKAVQYDVVEDSTPAKRVSEKSDIFPCMDLKNDIHVAQLYLNTDTLEINYVCLSRNLNDDIDTIYVDTDFIDTSIVVENRYDKYLNLNDSVVIVFGKHIISDKYVLNLTKSKEYNVFYGYSLVKIESSDNHYPIVTVTYEDRVVVHENVKTFTVEGDCKVVIEDRIIKADSQQTDIGSEVVVSILPF